MIGIFGGTFDPVHYGHLKPAQAVLQALGLSHIRFIPNRIPPHRQQPWLSVKQRLILLDLALQDYAEFILDQCELNRDGPSYMVDTLQTLKQTFVSESLCLILGLDAFIGFDAWYRWQDILQLCHLVITPRPGVEWPTGKISEQLGARITDDAKLLETEATGRILLQSVPQLAISSTEIRQCLQQGRLVQALPAQDASINKLMPPKVYQQLMRFSQYD